jgi:hypothetical protein
MRRREFLGVLGGAAALWPSVARAQQPKIIGFLGAGTATAWAPMVASFEQRLRELGWIDGQTVAIVYRWADGFISYGPNEVDQFRLAADYTDKILRGTRPADIPVAQPTKIELAINLKTAKMLGLTIPESFLLRADEVIE